MVSVIGEEFVAYTISKTGIQSNIPLIAVVRYDGGGKVQFREFRKQDILRIPPLTNASIVGGWLNRLSQPNITESKSDLSFAIGANSWVKRFVVVQGELVKYNWLILVVCHLNPYCPSDSGILISLAYT